MYVVVVVVVAHSTCGWAKLIRRILDKLTLPFAARRPKEALLVRDELVFDMREMVQWLFFSMRIDVYWRPVRRQNTLLLGVCQNIATFHSLGLAVLLISTDKKSIDCRSG